MRFKAAVVQMRCVPRDREANLQKAMTLIRQAATEGAKLVVLPEMFNTGYVPLEAKTLAESMRSASLGQLRELAAKRDLWIVGAMIERGDDGKFYDTAFLVTAVGANQSYRKIHLWGDEAKTLAPGNRVVPWTCRLGQIGPLVCHDLEYPDPANRYPALGAVHLVAPSAFMTPDLWERVTQERARESASYLLAANRIGTDDGVKFCGKSRIIAPDGKVLADAGDNESVAVAELDPQTVQEERRKRAGRTPIA